MQVLRIVLLCRKEVTPLSPIVEANEEHVNVVIAPNGEATQITVKYRTQTDKKQHSLQVKRIIMDIKQANRSCKCR